MRNQPRNFQQFDSYNQGDLDRTAKQPFPSKQKSLYGEGSTNIKEQGLIYVYEQIISKIGRIDYTDILSKSFQQLHKMPIKVTKESRGMHNIISIVTSKNEVLCSEEVISIGSKARVPFLCKKYIDAEYPVLAQVISRYEKQNLEQGTADDQTRMFTGPAPLVQEMIGSVNFNSRPVLPNSAQNLMNDRQFFEGIRNTLENGRLPRKVEIEILNQKKIDERNLTYENDILNPIETQLSRYLSPFYEFSIITRQMGSAPFEIFFKISKIDICKVIVDTSFNDTVRSAASWAFIYTFLPNLRNFILQSNEQDFNREENIDVEVISQQSQPISQKYSKINYISSPQGNSFMGKSVNDSSTKSHTSLKSKQIPKMQSPKENFTTGVSPITKEQFWENAKNENEVTFQEIDNEIDPKISQKCNVDIFFKSEKNFENISKFFSEKGYRLSCNYEIREGEWKFVYSLTDQTNQIHRMEIRLECPNQDYAVRYAESKFVEKVFPSIFGNFIQDEKCIIEEPPKEKESQLDPVFLKYCEKKKATILSFEKLGSFDLSKVVPNERFKDSLYVSEVLKVAFKHNSKQTESNCSYTKDADNNHVCVYDFKVEGQQFYQIKLKLEMKEVAKEVASLLLLVLEFPAVFSQVKDKFCTD